MKRCVQTVFCLSLLIALPACNPTTTSSSDPHLTPNAQVNSDKKSGTKVDENVNKSKSSDGISLDPKGIYANIPDKRIPFPTLDAVAVPYADVELNEEETGAFYTFADADFRRDYEKQLKSAGFEKKSDSVFLKITQEKNALIVEMLEGEGELVIRVFTNRDPFRRYRGVPDQRMPYPLDEDALASEFAEYFPPNEGSFETVYVYYNKPKAFVEDYERRLRDLGFKNVRTPKSPLYTRICQDNIELSVAIDQMTEGDVDADYISELRIKMMAIPLETP